MVAAFFLLYGPQRRCWHSPSSIIFILLPQGKASVLCGLSCGTKSLLILPIVFTYRIHHHTQYLEFLIFCILEVLALGNLILERPPVSS